jgi:hypothetical protein
MTSTEMICVIFFYFFFLDISKPVPSGEVNVQRLFRVLVKRLLHPTFGSYNGIFVAPNLSHYVMTVLWHSYFKLMPLFIFAGLAQIDRVTYYKDII